MAELYDADGNPIEALTPEEVEERLNEVKEEFQQTIEEVQQELQEKEEALQAAQEELEKEREKDKNFGKLRQKTKEKEDLVEKLTKELEEIKTKLGEMEKGVKVSQVEAAIKEMVGGDPEDVKKVKFYYDQFVGEPENEEKMRERIKNAMILAGIGGKTPLSGEAFGTGGGQPPLHQMKTSEGLPPEVEEMAKKRMGLTDEDLKLIKKNK